MQNEIKKSISKAMTKLVGFSLNEKKMNGHSIQACLHGEFRQSIWVCTPETDLDIIYPPESIDGIPEYEAVIEKFIAETTVKFHTPAEVLANLNAEVNE